MPGCSSCAPAFRGVARAVRAQPLERQIVRMHDKALRRDRIKIARASVEIEHTVAPLAVEVVVVILGHDRQLVPRWLIRNSDRNDPLVFLPPAQRPVDGAQAECRQTLAAQVKEFLNSKRAPGALQRFPDHPLLLGIPSGRHTQSIASVAPQRHGYTLHRA